MDVLVVDGLHVRVLLSAHPLQEDLDVASPGLHGVHASHGRDELGQVHGERADARAELEHGHAGEKFLEHASETGLCPVLAALPLRTLSRGRPGRRQHP